MLYNIRLSEIVSILIFSLSLAFYDSDDNVRLILSNMARDKKATEGFAEFTGGWWWNDEQRWRRESSPKH